MMAKVMVMKDKEFEDWYKGQKTVAVEKEGMAKEPAERGKELFSLKGCTACHSLDGTPRIGPTMKEIYGRKVIVITGGKERETVSDEAYLRRSIEEPKADIVKGFQPIMPPQSLSEEELSSLIEYLKQIK
jgi:cytochrome c oxidase subunit 2